ncbi:MAG: hypothetical protein ACX94C_10300 [Phycisphaerales bacterium]
MELEHAIISLWVISSMLACWAFSLIVRWFSDARARRVDRLKRQYTPRSRWIAAGLILLCIAGSLLAGAGATHISSMPGTQNLRLTSLGAIGLGMILFACLLAVWGATGDRSRGRMRCPRCWYDMQASEGLPCPECGHEAGSREHYFRTRRPRWAFVIAMVFLMTGSIGLGFNAKLRDQGWVGFIPTRVFLANWERFPESWVHDVGTGSDYKDLTHQLRSGEIADADRRAFVESLIDEMIEDPFKRWEERRMSLVHACMRQEAGKNYDYERKTRRASVWLPEEKRLERLYRACIEDLLGYAQRESNPIHEEIAIDIMHSLSMWQGNTHQTTRDWLLMHQEEMHGPWHSAWNAFSPEQVDYLRGLLGDLPDRFLQTKSDSFYTDREQMLTHEMLGIEMETGVLRERVPGFMELYESDQTAEREHLPNKISAGISTMPEHDRDAAIAVILRWLADGDPELRKAALSIISTVYMIDHRPDGDPISARADMLISAIRTHALTDDRPASERYPDDTISDRALRTIGAIDHDGTKYFPLLRDAILDPDTRDRVTQSTNFNTFRSSEARIANWIEIFEPLTTHPDPDVRLWLAHQVPRRTGSESDERFNAMIRTLSNDADPEVRDRAMVRMMDRNLM